MPNPPVDLTIRVPRPLGPELPNVPILPMLLVQEPHELVERVTIGALGIGPARPRGRDYEGRYVAQVEVGFGVFSARAGDELAEEGGHCLCIVEFGRR